MNKGGEEHRRAGKERKEGGRKLLGGEKQRNGAPLRGGARGVGRENERRGWCKKKESQGKENTDF